jgi:benzylsuccinate CoA-transferase BbsE subunit
MSLLPPIRVLDLGGEWTGFPGVILAEMGAEVILVERPGGDAARNRLPQAGGVNPAFAAWNLSKKSVTLDIETDEGRAILKDLIADSDVVLESHRPGTLAALGLAPEKLIADHPSLIVTSLTAFGQTGPRAANAASDTTLMALSGLMAVTGFPGLPPLRLGYDQIASLGALQAALGTMMAIFARGTDGQGQYVDVSILDAARLANYREPLRWEFQQAIETRKGNGARRGRGGFVSTIWRCKDGWITWSPSDDPKRSQSFIETANAIGIGLDWKDHDFAGHKPADMPQAEIDRLESDIAPFFLRHTRAELEAMATEKGWMLIALLDLKEAAAQPQLAARDFWTSVPIGGQNVPVPAFPFKTSEAQPQQTGPVPHPGQHNAEVLGAVRDAAQLAALQKAGVI